MPTLGTNTSTQPARMPGMVSGSVTSRNAFHGAEPRSRAASTRVKSILSTALWHGRIIMEIRQ